MRNQIRKYHRRQEAFGALAMAMKWAPKEAARAMDAYLGPLADCLTVAAKSIKHMSA